MNHLLASNLFKAIADPVRLRILHVLNVEEVTVGELVRILDLPQSTVSRHVKALKEEGLVTDRGVGPTTFYRANLDVQLPDGYGGLRQTLHEMLSQDSLSGADREKITRVIAVRSVQSENFFDHIGIRWDALREQCFGTTFHLEAFLGLLPSEWTVADLGTGTGYMLPVLARNFQKVYAVDSNSTMLDIAKRRVENPVLKKKVAYVESRLEKLDIADESVDLAIAVLMLHHLSDIEPAVREVARILKSGGKFLVVDFGLHDNETFQTQMGDYRPGIAPEDLRVLFVAAGLEAGAARKLEGARGEDSPGIGTVPELYVLEAVKLPLTKKQVLKDNALGPDPIKKSLNGMSPRKQERKS